MKTRIVQRVSTQRLPFGVLSEQQDSKGTHCTDENLPIPPVCVAGHSAPTGGNPVIQRDRGFYVGVGWKLRLRPGRCTPTMGAENAHPEECLRRRQLMEIGEFEKAIRAAIGNDLIRPALAAPGLNSQIDVQMPPEFQAAAKSLASRSGEQPREDSLLRSIAAQWS